MSHLSSTLLGGTGVSGPDLEADTQLTLRIEPRFVVPGPPAAPEPPADKGIPESQLALDLQPQPDPAPELPTEPEEPEPTAEPEEPEPTPEPEEPGPTPDPDPEPVAVPAPARARSEPRAQLRPKHRPRPQPRRKPDPGPRPEPTARPERAPRPERPARPAPRPDRRPDPVPASIPGRGRIARALIITAILVVSIALGAGVVFVATRPGPSSGSEAVPTTPAIPTSVPANLEPPPVLTGPDQNAPVPTTSGLQATLAEALAAPELGSLGAVVVDPQTGTTLLDQGASTVLQPGSTVKLYTAMAAAQAIEPGTRFETTVLQGAQPGEVVLVGGGDPTLSSLPTSKLYPGAASIQDLVAQINAAGVTSVSRVVLDVSLFSGPATAQGWGPGDAPSTYAAPVLSLMVDGGRTSPEDRAVRSALPGAAAGRLLATALGSPDAAIEVGSAPAGAPVLATVRSAPVEDLIEQAISTSDNLLADVLARHVAIAVGEPASFAGAVTAMTTVLDSIGVDLTGFLAYDGSGLSVDNRTTAASVASLLQVAASGTQPRTDVVLSALAVGGYNGTLATRFRGADSASAAGQIRAKTGTLTGVDALAGTVLTADGRLLVFAFLSNGGAGPDATRAALDTLAADLAGCGCA